MRLVSLFQRKSNRCLTVSIDCLRCRGTHSRKPTRVTQSRCWKGVFSLCERPFPQRCVYHPLHRQRDHHCHCRQQIQPQQLLERKMACFLDLRYPVKRTKRYYQGECPLLWRRQCSVEYWKERQCHSLQDRGKRNRTACSTIECILTSS